MSYDLTPLKVGLTGGIGSGKTTVCRVFETLGVPIYDADTQAKRLMNTDPELKTALKGYFGSGVYLDDGTLDRRKLAEIIFNDPASLEKDVVGALRRLWRKSGRDDVESLLEQPIEAELPHGEDRMASRPVGEDQLAPRQSCDFARKQRVGFEAGPVDIVNELQKALSLVDVLLQQSTQGRAMTRIIMLVESASGLTVDAEKLDQKQRDPLIDARPNSAVRRV